MKRTLIILISVTSLITHVYSQDEDCSCKTDLTFLDSKIRKTPAYKMNKTAYEASYSNILSDVTSVNSLFDCHALLNTLLISLNDNHSRVYSINPGATKDVKSDPEKLTEFKSSRLYNSYPKPKIDLDSLKSVLHNTPKMTIEGIYTRANYMTIGVFKHNDHYKAIILDSESDVWQVGELMYTLLPFGEDYLLGIGGGISSKRLIAYTERIDHGFFYFMGFQKDMAQKNYAIQTLSTDTYKRKELSDDITYLKIGSFNSWHPTLANAEHFYKSLEGRLNKRHLIIDLRNNGGGGDRNSDILYKLVKDYAKKNKVYLLINHRTVSNAEQFAFKLSRLKNCQLFGKKTNGTLAYEIKESSFTLPCNNFRVVLTSKKHSKYLEFESKGIQPNFELEMDSDWIEQLKTHIENHK